MLSQTLGRVKAGLGSVTGRTQTAVPLGSVDTGIIWVAGILMVIGAVMVYSASIALPDAPRFANYKPWHFLARHLFAIAVGVGLSILAFTVPIREWQRWSKWLFLFGLVLLVIVLIPGVGKVVYGARRWLSLYVLNLQPSELMKIFVILYVLFLGGVSGRLFTGLVAVGVVTFGTLIMLSPWRRERIFAYLDPFSEQNALGKGYQLSHSLIAFGRGELFGVGLGGSVEKLHYLPEAHTDFLLAVIGEELGLVAVLAIVVMFFWLTRRAFEIGRLAIRLDRTFAGLVAQGIGLWLGLQAFINMGVNVGLLPTKGLTLPLMSYGGSGILANCVAVAILLRVDFENRMLMRGAK